jgi:hypothetical protein
MIPQTESEAGLLAYEQTLAFAALRRKRLPLVYVLFPILLALMGAVAWTAGVFPLAGVCWASAILFTLFAAWNWRRLRALDLRNRALLTRLHAQYGDNLPWLEVERQQRELQKIEAELSAKKCSGGL